MARTGFNHNRNTPQYSGLPSLSQGNSLWSANSGRKDVPSLPQGNVNTNVAPMQLNSLPPLGQDIPDGGNLSMDYLKSQGIDLNPGFKSIDLGGIDGITPGSDQLTPDWSTPDISDSGKTGFDLWGKGGRNIGAAMQGLGSIGSALSAYKMYKVGKQTLDQNKQAFNLNAANQAKITNAQIQDQARYNAANRNKSLAGDFAAIDLASQKEYNERKISGQGIA